jgi:ATP-binding cassette, subfamily G (WHITE), member 2, PDR
MVLLAMLSIFRTIAALTGTVEQALSIAGIMVLAIANYAGYSIPRSSMKPWFIWISYINPV